MIEMLFASGLSQVVNSALINYVHHARHHDLILEHAKEKEDFKTHSGNLKIFRFYILFISQVSSLSVN